MSARTPFKMLPAFRPVALKLIHFNIEALRAFKQIADVLSSDSELAAMLLQLANSAAVGCRYEVRSVQQAIGLLGFDRVKALALTAGLRDYTASSASDEILRGCWRHNLATALIAQRLSRWTDEGRDVCYTAGLLHDIGRLLLLRLFPEDYRGFLRAGGGLTTDSLRTETGLFGINHCDLGADAMQSWSLPEILQCPARHHHDEPRFDGKWTLDPVVQLACRLAGAIGFAAVSTITAAEVDPICQAFAPIQQPMRNAIDQLELQIGVEVNEMECLGA